MAEDGSAAPATTGRKGRTVGVRKATLVAAAKEAAKKGEEK